MTSKFYKSYTIAFKFRALKFLETSNITKTAEKYSIDRKLVRRWRDQKQRLAIERRDFFIKTVLDTKK